MPQHVFFYGTLMTPFNRPGRQRVAEKLSFSGRGRIRAALFDLGKKLLLGGGVGAAMRWGSGRPRLVLVALLAALLEAAQLCQPMHTASTTDIITIYGGAILGAFLVSQSRTLSAGRRVPVAPPS